MRALPIAAVFFVALLRVTEVSAQLLMPPPRSNDGLFGGSTTRSNQSGHQLSVDASAFGSYEEGLLGGPGDPTGAAVAADPLVPGTRRHVGNFCRYRSVPVRPNRPVLRSRYRWLLPFLPEPQSSPLIRWQPGSSRGLENGSRLPHGGRLGHVPTDVDFGCTGTTH